MLYDWWRSLGYIFELVISFAIFQNSLIEGSSRLYQCRQGPPADRSNCNIVIQAAYGRGHIDITDFSAKIGRICWCIVICNPQKRWIHKYSLTKYATGRCGVKDTPAIIQDGTCKKIGVVEYWPRNEICNQWFDVEYYYWSPGRQIQPVGIETWCYLPL